ncbi:MAG: bifunctional (p)ppGpp synthetase/guanosine-3',5'-bis(diphosphate) 3'-pyrophosphohydrolase [Oscillospiraceae bacterium]|jgi:GTP pyrophosphokinase|nr:bifunctional (p)ppGpp synthetase/guanosine-3',5'-bis(diphosphate) 3'-pyrophosphohydrolase [Oscillospiraceae bacterium]
MLMQVEFYKKYEDLKLIVQKKRKKFDLNAIEKAYKLACKSHKSQKRYSGIPYIYHPISVAYILAELDMDTDSIVAALLHDVVEDTNITISYLSKEFGKNISSLVDSITKLGKIPLSTKEERQAENLRKMLIAMAQDVRVIIIKLVDRLHNMRTIDCMPAQHRRDKSLETMEIYAPIAHRLGMKAVQEELEDISIKLLDPIACEKIEQNLKITRDSKDKILKEIKNKILNHLKKDIPDAHVEARAKSIWSIYRKIFVLEHQMEEIYDMFAIRIIVATVKECYNILGIIHNMFTPLTNRFKDYISTPKPNFYQSLHTTVIDTNAIPFEVQIRTWDMHYTSEYGVAAHWKYKSGISTKDSFESRLSWLRRMIENQIDNHSAGDLIRDIKTDLASEEIYAFTPQGDLISLPVGATAIDFAYSIHSEIGNKMIGAKVDKRMVPISTKIKNGQIVEIIKSKDPSKGPNRNWLKVVRTIEARNRIRNWLKKEKKEENILEGRKIVEREILSKIKLEKEEIEPFLKTVSKKQKCDSLEKFFELIGYSGINLKKFMPKIKEECLKFKSLNEPENTTKNLSNSNKKNFKKNVIVDGLVNRVVTLAKCCNPIPGDDICALITKGFNAAVHKQSCIKVPQLDGENHSRWVNAHWRTNLKCTFNSKLELMVVNKEGVLADITLKLSLMNIFIDSLNTRSIENNLCLIVCTIIVKNLDHLNAIIIAIKQIKDVLSVQRA